jgi:vesicle-fusing ATPase
LIARQLAKALNAPAPKVVNGPDIFQRFVGQSEENIRELFAPAESDSAKFGADSPLHVIVFDEIDAIMKVKTERKLHQEQRGNHTKQRGNYIK